MAEAEPDMDDDVPMDETDGLLGQGILGSKTIVIHPGSQNLRIGLANDALPKTVPMVVARRWQTNESEDDGGEPKPKRLKIDDGDDMEPEKMFGEEVCAFSSFGNIVLNSHSLLLNTLPCLLS